MLKTLENFFYKILGYTLLAAFIFIVSAIESIVDLLLKAVGL